MSGKFIVINKKKMMKILVYVGVIAIMCVNVLEMANTMIEVASKNRLLPIYSVGTSKNQVALTFDCAWGADDIPSIIEILNNNNLKATFFTVGDWATKNSEMVSKLNESGMEIRKSYFKSCSCGTDVLWRKFRRYEEM